MSLLSLFSLLFNFNIPIRWQIMIILCFSTFIIFMLRINMSVATLQIAKDLSWTETELQNVLSSLYYGYAFGQLPFNFLSHKYGGSIALGISVTISCILNLFIPIASKTSISSVMILQVFVGFFQAGAFPSCYYLYPRWMPISERTVMVAFVVTGVYMGEIVGLGLSGYLVNMKNIYVNNFQIGSWDSCFYVTSLFGVIWFPLFYYFVYDSPSEHPRITDEEYEFIHKGSGFREESEDHEKIVKNVKDNTNEIFIKLDDGESNGDISLIETSLNPIKNVEESQTSSSERNTQQYNSLKQNNDNDNDIENNNFIQDSEKNSIVIDEKSTIVNPLYLSTSTEKEKNEEKSSVVWLHDLKLHPNWHPALPPGRLHHHYHIHHSHKLELHKIPWLKIFTNTASIALLINTFAQGWVTLMILSEMPAFLHQQLGCDISHSSYLSILPYIFNLISVELFSIVFNYLMVKGILTRWQVRQLANRIGLLGPGICVVIVGHVTDPAIGVIILCLALFLFGAVQSGTPCGFMDIAPNFSSEMNTVAIVFLSCAGFLTPMLVSYYQRLYPTSLAWQYVFYITLLICGVAILVWKIFGKSEIIAELNTRI